MKGELAATRAESVVLRRTEQILKGRDEVKLTLLHADDDYCCMQTSPSDQGPLTAQNSFVHCRRLFGTIFMIDLTALVDPGGGESVKIRDHGPPLERDTPACCLSTLLHASYDHSCVCVFARKVFSISTFFHIISQDQGGVNMETRQRGNYCEGTVYPPHARDTKLCVCPRPLIVSRRTCWNHCLAQHKQILARDFCLEDCVRPNIASM